MATIPCFTKNGLTNMHHDLRILQMTPPAALPESPCSVNAYLHIPGIADRVQVTGRGMTAHEAAANLRDLIAETKAVLAPPQALPQPAPAIADRTQQIGALLACGLKKATKKGDWTLVERLGKAAALVLSDAVSLGEREGMLAVQSQSHPDHYYEVDGIACSCPDFEMHVRTPNYYCKHGLAAAMWTRLNQTAPANL